MEKNDLMKKIVSLAKRRGFVFQSSEIYGGVEALWDYGPLGSLMKNNIKKAWLKRFVQERSDISLIDATVIMHPRVWEASGHLTNFTDPLVECKKCHARYREDHLEKKECPSCGSAEFTDARNFNLMFKTFLGPVENEDHVAYLRPETAQSMFTNFKLVQESQRYKIPFGIAQIGRAFRNEITTGNYIFRMREFEQMEIEYFVKPGEDEKAFESWLDEWEAFLLSLGLEKESLRRREHEKEELAHYAKRAVDFEYKFPFGWKELVAVANRTDFDLKQHSEHSKQDLSYYDEETKEKYIPYVVEPTMGIDRIILALLVDAYEETEARTKTTEAAKEAETTLKLSKRIAPIKVAVLPLMKNKTELTNKAKEVYRILQDSFMCQYDEVGSIGRRYRRQDEIGTPYCVTIDFDTLKDDTVTLRDRDTMEQERIKILDLPQALPDTLTS